MHPTTCRTASLLLPLLIALAGMVPAHAAQPVPELAWSVGGFATPESVVYDRDRDQFYVSNMATRGEGATPGDGFISRLDGHGNIAELKWVTGLQNPKGLALANGRLYAGDDDALVEIDLDAAAIVARHAPEDGGPGQFNDATADADGNVYVFSRRLDTVYRLSGGTFAPWVKVDTHVTGKFNGLRADGDRLLLGSWQVPGPDGEQLGHLTTIDLADGSVGRIGSMPIGHIDGIEPDGRGGWTVTDWTHGALLHVDADGTPTRLLTLVKGSADHVYLPDRQLLLIPFLLDDVLRAYRWAPAAD
ncbi:SMP-30/gluconolactonase/LRE family protein [Pseudoxanthomonas suwonensis]|uniref:SMP-30/Gluconolaconase/LRE-like region-containing protein n=1 Tax=Pseudoxanthomonas suwonensis TaxID=314722 RepID=A0A0E3Z221_9GAMM|nr:hypothetical protein [Pseudoxanthomonas suwonensis]AKC87094.1 hypothetical protein WQ53_10405 [Pseudoxanthomonas suwonensis]